MNPTAKSIRTSAAQEQFDNPLSSSSSASSASKVPGIAELLRGSPFFKDDRNADAAAFAETTIRRIGTRKRQADSVLPALRRLMSAPTANDFLAASRALERDGRPDEREAVIPEAVARCYFYRAVSGDADAVRKVAAHAVQEAYSSNLDPQAVRGQVAGAVAWLLAAAGHWPAPAGWTRQTAAAFLTAVDGEAGPARGMVQRMLESRHSIVEGHPQVVLPDDPGLAAAPGADKSAISAAESLLAFRVADRSPSHQVATQVVVLKEVGNAVGDVGARVALEFQPLLGAPLPLALLPTMSAVRNELLVAFPYAEAVIGAVLSEVSSSSHVKLRPTVFVGPAGIGKSRFCIMLGQLLGVPTRVYHCSSVEDALPGMSRRWTTGEPSIPVAVMRAHRHASPAIVLDDIDTASEGLSAALLSLLEPHSARTWYDPYVEAPVDLSHILWLATAQNLAGLPPALRERWKFIAFPCPRADDLELLVSNILGTSMAERLMDPRWVAPLTGAERHLLRRYWQGGSLRYLTRLIEEVLAARERLHAVH